jgi:hypothetical protein
MTSENQLSAVKTVPADVATANADATYGQPEADLINELKTKVNSLLAIVRRMQ